MPESNNSKNNNRKSTELWKTVNKVCNKNTAKTNIYKIDIESGKRNM